jgi:hypothetical protein
MTEAEEMLSFRQRMPLFTSPDGECYATFEVDGRKQTQQVGWTCLPRSFKTRGECSHIRDGVHRLRYDAGLDARTGKRKQPSLTFYGDAEEGRAEAPRLVQRGGERHVC